MNNRISELYQAMLVELHSRLEDADRIFIRMSELLLGMMSAETLSETQKSELRELDRQHRELLAEVVTGLSRVYSGRIELFPPAKGGFIDNLEQRNAQSEELERIVNRLLEESGCKIDNRSAKAGKTWRKMMENIDFKAEFERNFSEAEQLCKRPNILVAGYTGSGKTSLIRTVLGSELVPAEGIHGSRPCRIEFDCYENGEIRLWDSRGLELGEREKEFREKLKEFIAERQNESKVEDHVHLVWYLIQGNGARVTDCDLALMKEIFTSGNVIAVISKRDITKTEQSGAIRKTLTDAGIPEERIVEVSDTEGGAIGCRELVALSRRMLPDAYRDAFLAAQQIDREARALRIAEKSDTARAIVRDAAVEAGKIAEVPISLSENCLLLPVGITMAAKLASLYGLRERQMHADAAAFVKSVVMAAPELFPWRKSSTVIDSASSGTLIESLGTYLRNSFEAHVLAKIKGTPLPPLGFDLELFKQFHRTYKKGMKMKPNILVCGKTGVGKTSLIQAVTHRGVVPDSAIGDGKPITVGFQVYETEAANFIDSEGMNPGQQTVDEYADFILNELLQRLNAGNRDKLIHNIWYCIDGSGARIQDTDAKLIKTFSDKVILVVTKCELMRKEQVESVMDTLLDLIDRDRIVLVSSENRTGLKQLIAKTETMSAAAMGRASEEQEAFRNRWDNYYSNMRRAWTESVSGEADSYINWAAGRAAAIALVPLPLADVGPLIANEVYMLYKLAGVYGIAADNTVITMLLGCAGGSIAGKIGASCLPFLKVPIAAAVTYGVGKAAKAYFESDMTMDEDELRQEFLAGEREAKKKDWKNAGEETR